MEIFELPMALVILLLAGLVMAFYCALPIFIIFEFYFLITDRSVRYYSNIIGVPLSAISSIFFVIALYHGSPGIYIVLFAPFIVGVSISFGYTISRFYNERDSPLLPRSLKAWLATTLTLLSSLSLICVHFELPHEGTVIDSVSTEPVQQVLVRQILEYKCGVPLYPIGEENKFMGYSETLSDNDGNYSTPYQFYFKYPYFCYGDNDSLEFVKAGYFSNTSSTSEKKISLTKANLFSYKETTTRYHFTPDKYPDEIATRSLLTEKIIENNKKLYPIPQGELGVFLLSPGRKFTKLVNFRDNEVYGKEIFFAFDQNSAIWIAFDRRGVLLEKKITKNPLSSKNYEATNWVVADFYNAKSATTRVNDHGFSRYLPEINIGFIKSMIWSLKRSHLYLVDGTDKIYRFNASGEYDFKVKLMEKPFNGFIQNEVNSNHLFWAVRKGDCDLIEILLKSGADPNAKDRDGHTPLYYAQKYASTKSHCIFNKLLEYNADPSIKDQKGNLMLAFTHIQNSPKLRLVFIPKKNKLNLASLLLKNSSNPNLMHEDGENLLISCVKNTDHSNDTFCLQLLLSAGIDPSSINFEGKSPLMIAIDNNNLRTANLLLGNGASAKIKNDNGQTLFWPLLRNSSCDYNRLNRDGTLSLLFKHGVQLSIKDNNGETILRWAEKHCKSESIDLLLALDNEYSQLNKSVQQGNINLVRFLLEGTNRPEKRVLNYALFNAVASGRKQIVELLLQKGATPNIQNQFGETCLWKAAGTADIEMLLLLLKYGANVNHTDKKGKTVIWSILTGNSKQKNLPYNSEPIVSHTRYGIGFSISRPIIFYNSSEQELDFIRVLIDNGLDPFAKDNKGYSALKFAKYYNNKTLVDFLQMYK